MNSLIKVALADDHRLLRHGLAELINKFVGYQVVLEADNGADLLANLSNDLPDLVLLDLNMPVKDGYATALELKSSYPTIKVLALSMYDDEESIFRILRCGARGHILKDVPPTVLKSALDAMVANGYAYNDNVTGKMMKVINSLTDEESQARTMMSLTIREIEFLKYACTEMTYKEIAEKMSLSVRTIDGYREGLFEKLQVTSRVGMVTYAIRQGIYRL